MLLFSYFLLTIYCSINIIIQEGERKQGYITNKVIKIKEKIKEIKMKARKIKEERKLLLEFIERERIHYHNLAELFARKFSEKWFGKTELDKIEEE